MMDTMPPLYVSSMLREAASLKINELEDAKRDFRRLYHVHAGNQIGIDLKTQVKNLFEDVKKTDPSVEKEDEFELISHYFKHADDPSISRAKLLKIQQALLGRLRKHFARLECSSLHVQLMNEAMGPSDSTTSTTSKLASIDLEDDFEVVDSNKPNEVLEKFKTEAFITDDVDVNAIEAYLKDLDTNITLREYDDDDDDDMPTSEGMEIGQEFMMWCVTDLLKNDLISEDKKRRLSEYLQSPIALKELTSIINAKSLRLWNYKDAEKGLPVVVREDAAGEPRVVVEEGIIDMLFLHCVGIGFAMKLKGRLDRFSASKTFDVPYLTNEESNKREFFLGRHPLKVPPPAPQPTVCSMCHPYAMPAAPMPPPPPPPIEICPPPPVVEVICPPPPPPPPGFPGAYFLPISRKKSKFKAGYGWNFRGSLDSTRRQTYLRDFFLSRLPEEDGCSPTTMSIEEVQAKLIKTLVVERELRKAFDGETNLESVKFNSLASSLPHKTILAVLKFLQLPEAFITFSERFLSAKLNMGPAVRGGRDRILSRAAGIPEGHALELFYTEAVMCFLEISVRQKTGTYLYRLKDHCYFIGNNDQSADLTAEVMRFADVMGLDISFSEHGEEEIGLLTLGNDKISINAAGANEYARSVKRQLKACTTVLDWVRVWNNTIGTYASHLVGPLTTIMGKAHLQAIKETYKTMFDIILDKGDLTAHITTLLSKHIKIPAIDVEPLIYLPQAYGGLGVKNPFITLALAHEMPENPLKDIESFLQSEETYYNSAVANYTILDAEGRARKLESIFESDQTRIDAALGHDRDLSLFMTKEELVAHRERAAYPTLPMPPYPAPWTSIAVPSLTNVYDELLRGVGDDISGTEKIRDEIRRLSGKGDMKPWRRLSPEDSWVLQLYGDECFETYGGLEIWCGENVPQEVLKVVRGGAWDDDDDDDTSSSVSDMTEP